MRINTRSATQGGKPGTASNYLGLPGQTPVRPSSLRCQKTSLLRGHDTPLTLHCPARERTQKRRFRGVDRTHVPAAGPASQPRRVHFQRSPEAVHGPNHFGRRPMSGFPRRRGGRLCGRSLLGGFAFLLPASSACARSLLVPGTCDLTSRWTDASDSAAPCAWSSPAIPAP